MLDIKIFRDQPDETRRRLATRGRGDESRVTEVLEQDELRRKLIAQTESLKAERNKISKQVGIRKSKGESADDLFAKIKRIPEEIAEMDAALAKIEASRDSLLLTIPNLPHESVPVGEDEKANR